MDPTLLGATLALLTAITWAFGVILFKKSSDIFSPFALNYFKNWVALIGILVTLPLVGDPEPGTVTQAVLLAASGVVGIAFADSLFLRCLHLLGAGRTAIIETLYIPTTIISAMVFLGEDLSWVGVLGAILVVGAVLWVVEGAAHAGARREAQLEGIALGVVAIVSMGISIVAVKPILEESGVLWATLMRLGGGQVAMTLLLPIAPRLRAQVGELLKLPEGFHYALGGGVVGTYAALLLWVGGFKYAPAIVASIMNQTSTLFVVLFAALFLGETLTWRKLAAVFAAMSGCILVVLGSIG
jgi:drug/metabolite transporter (DMT)-like permease